MGDTTSQILIESLNNKELSQLSLNQIFYSDFLIWVEVLKDRPEAPILQNAVKEYQIAMFALSYGFYQQV